MFRTRDFILVLSTVVFLLVAIGVTLSARGGYSLLDLSLKTTSNEETSYPAVVYSPETQSREDRLASMRSKIAAGGELSLSAPELVIDEAALNNDSEVVVVDSGETALVGLKQCSNYSAYSGAWSPQGVQFTVVEGARLVYRENQVSGTTTSETRDVLLQLPMYSIPAKNKTNCIPSDVIGIAQDGSLIRNSEAGMYQVFNDNTLIGYALDGFPIYGASQVATDVCGGAIVSGQYHYFLSKQRDTVLNCFAATPTAL
jgi:hypothetical protein